MSGISKTMPKNNITVLATGRKSQNLQTSDVSEGHVCHYTYFRLYSMSLEIGGILYSFVLHFIVNCTACSHFAGVDV
jgi:hypothetical protein